MQQTIQRPISCSGIGVHSGNPIHLTLRPADLNHGIQFKRTDIEGDQSYVPATWKHVSDTAFCTKISNAHGVTVATIEHLMAALYVAGIDNVLVEVSGPELPIMDGSASPFLFLIDCAGVKGQGAPRQILKILKTVAVKTDDGRQATLSPHKGFKVSVELPADGRNPFLPQSFSSQDIPRSFRADIARARTYGFFEDAQKMWDAGLAKGASLENTVVIDGAQVMNPQGLRYTDECVRHKVLDVLGDLYTAGTPIQGHFHGVACGHTLQNQLLHALFQDSDAWEFIEEPSPVRAAHPVMAWEAQDFAPALS